jgi:hypothetical protein
MLKAANRLLVLREKWQAQEVETLARKRGSQVLGPKVARESGSGEPAVAVSNEGLVTFGTQSAEGGVTVNVQTLTQSSAEVQDQTLNRRYPVPLLHAKPSIGTASSVLVYDSVVSECFLSSGLQKLGI